VSDGAKVWAATRLGLVRAANEDRWRVGGVGGGAADADWAGPLPDDKPWAVVADGMGGHGAGDVASSVALDTLCSLLGQDGPPDIRSAIAEANWAVFAAMDEPFGRRGMGTTLAGFCRAAGRFAVFNVGDSRVYILRGGRLELLTVDDTLPRRASGRSSALTQSLGGTSMPVPLDPHIAAVEPAFGDRLIICTDGLTDMLAEEAMCARLRAVTGNPAAALADAAVDAGGRDNVTVIVAAF
jgi:serine/threonine protein phosphatase PrpC